MLGWKIGNWKSDYKIPLPMLTDEEEEVIRSVEEMFKEASKYEEVSSREKAKEIIKELINEYADEEGILIEKDQMQYLTEMALLHIYDFSFLSVLLKDDNIEEITVIGIGENKPVYVYVRNVGWQKTNACFTDINYLIDIINKMSRTLGRRITFQSPRLNAILPDGSRLHASIPPISTGEVTIRKFREKPFTVFDLLKYHTVSADALSLLWLLMQSDISIIISGNTASGKTTTLNALFSFVPLTERILITEETPEINIPHPHKVNLVSNDELNITIASLVADSLRMRPDRVIVGEVRTSEELSALIDTILSGQARGSYATFHAQSSVEALRRMHSLGVLDIDLQSVDVILVQRRMMKYNVKTHKMNEIRRVVDIAEVDKEKVMKVKPLVSYDYENDKWIINHKDSDLLKRVRKSLGLTESDMKNELKRRTQFLKKNLRKNMSFEDSVREIQKFAYK
ncbi:CpaF family protein [Candidatus Micrarchaeota archaeon]|nr:CpaF family protein [Candidatus Micrarchaeota archaeon]